jgi:thiol-disulfide isomerase/thioredoxin
MKKLLKSFILITAILITGNLIAGDRLMIIEFFTSSTCGPCATYNPILTAFMSSHDAERISAIGYHMSWPAPGNDPMYWYNIGDNDGRRNLYGINSIPQGRFDGSIVLSSYSTGIFQSYYDQRINILSPVSIILSDSTFGDSVKVRAMIYCETYIANPTVNVYVSVGENHIHYTSPPGVNGETDFYTVMRKMLPNYNGTQITLFPGDKKVLEFKYKMDPIWNASEMFVMAYVQNPVTKEMYTAAKKTQNFTLLPSPGYKSVQLGQSSSATFSIKVPTKAAGYTSPITFTTEVDPVTTGVNVTLPGGNVLSNFNDSLAVQVSSTAAVPTGVYKVIVTGTNAFGKYHKTAVNYLVGKNYVSVQTNRGPEAQFSVNGTVYGSPQIYEWNFGSSQVLRALPQAFADHRLVFMNWSNGGDTTQTITVNSNTGNYTANFKTQFKVLSVVTPAGLASLVTVTGGNVFYDSGSTASISISPTQVQYNGLTYYFKRWLGGGNGSYSGTNQSFQINSVNNFINQVAIFDTINTGINQIGMEVPEKYELSQNYPNPFNPSTTVKFNLPKAGDVSLKLYDILGKEVDNLFTGFLSAGYFQINFNAASLSSGVYFYRIETENFADIKRMLLVK